MGLILTIFIAAVTVVVIFILLPFAIAPFARGAIFLPIHKKRVDTMIALSSVRPEDKVVDLGSGDGRIVIEFAKAGAEAHGYEINPFLVWLSRKNIREAGLKGKAFVHWKSFWRVNLSDYSIVTLFGINYIMKDLEQKLLKELTPGSRVVSYLFQFPTWQSEKKEYGVFLYKK